MSLQACNASQQHAVVRQLADQIEGDALPALQRLMKLAEDDESSTARCVRLFLLGLYHGEQWKFDLTDLRGLDALSKDDAFRVLRLDAYVCRREIHRYLEDGEERFFALWIRERPEHNQ